MLGFCVAVGSWLLYTSARVARSRTRLELDRLYGARDLDELRVEYDRIAGEYDGELVGAMGYQSHRRVAAATRKLLPPEARILDVGAGTGLLGAELAEAGFTVSTVSISPGMLAEARRTGVYGDLREGRLRDDSRTSRAATTASSPRAC